MRHDPKFNAVVLLLLVACYVAGTAGPLPSAAMPAFPGLGGFPVSGDSGDESPWAPPPAGTGSLRFEPGVSLFVEQQDLILDYMDAYFRTLVELATYYPEDLFAPGTDTQVMGDRAVWEITAAVRKMQAVDLRLDAYGYELVCSSVTEDENGDVTVRLTENNVQRFRQYPGLDSKSSGIRHGFTLTQVDGRWYIKQHRGGGTVSHLIMRGPEHDEDVDMLDVMDTVPETKDMLIGDAEANIAAREAQRGQGAGAAPPRFEHPYNRGAAVAYANRWALERNPDRWPVYDEFGGNCANFVSQCLFAGGIPMDWRGADQWKWFGEKHTLSQKPSGRSASWASVDSFYEYAVQNRGYGMVVRPDANYYTGEPGDILQLGFLGDWRHAVTITSVIKDDAGNVIDYLITSNTTDQQDFPASAYMYTMQRLIKVYGWND